MDLSNYLLFSDLDRTLIPNGAASESPAARAQFTDWVQRRGLRLVYVSGRHLSLLKQAIEEFNLPMPLAAIGDVGGSVFTIQDAQWHDDQAWRQHILQAWHQVSHRDIRAALADIADLRLQEDDQQAEYKLSYYTPRDILRDILFTLVRQRLKLLNVSANLIWSVDEEKNCGLLDVMPPAVSKLHAIHYLAQKWHVDLARCFFSGDSGNDLSVIVDGSLNCILVNNAPVEVKQEAQVELAHKGLAYRLYIARGNHNGMNGNYAAGVLEGLQHFLTNSG